jgi:poly-gamma-glutamate synthesis protein (capsule biosynthesis protein)
MAESVQVAAVYEPAEPEATPPPALPTPSPVPIPTPTPAPTPAPPVVYETTLAFVGDLMVHQAQLDFAYQRETGDYDFNESFQEVAALFASNGLTIGNLETTLPGPEGGYSCFPLFGAPDAFAEALKNAGFGLLSTANNHSLDKREAGLLRTLRVLDEAGIGHVGTYASQAERDTIRILNVDGIRFAFLSYSYSTNSLPIPKGKPYLINLIDDALIFSDIERAKKLHPDFIIILPHMGYEYETHTREHIRAQVRRWFEAGADMVLGHHPHVLQPFEMVEIQNPDGNTRTCFAAYSLGNFVSGQRTVPRDAGIIVRLHVQKTSGQAAKLMGISYIPTWVQFTDHHGRRSIKVLPVYEALADFADQNRMKLRPQDATRLRQVHHETAKRLLNADIALSDIQPEYWFYENE